MSGSLFLEVVQRQLSTWKLEQKYGLYFIDILFNENLHILIPVSQYLFLLEGPIDNNIDSGKGWANDNRPLPEPMVTQTHDTI